MLELKVNLDGYEPDDLDKLTTVFETLAGYSKTKARAIRNRKAGNWGDALPDYSNCERYFNELPEWARW